MTIRIIGEILQKPAWGGQMPPLIAWVKLTVSGLDDLIICVSEFGVRFEINVCCGVI